MNLTFLLACGWLTLSCLVALIPHKDLKPHAAVLLAPFPFLLIAVFWNLGFWWGLILLLGALSIFRYPAKWAYKYIVRKVRMMSGRPAEGAE